MLDDLGTVAQDDQRNRGRAAMPLLTTAATAPDPRAFRGAGLAFPLAVTPQGQLATASDQTKVEQSIWLILSTAKQERLMRPDYGCGIHDLVFAPSAPQSVGQIVDQLRRALVAQEPRIDVLDVTGQIPAGRGQSAAAAHRLPHSRKQRAGQHGLSVLHHRGELSHAARKPAAGDRRSHVRRHCGGGANPHPALHAGMDRLQSGRRRLRAG